MEGGYKVPADGDTDHMFIAPGPNVCHVDLEFCHYH